MRIPDEVIQDLIMIGDRATPAIPERLSEAEAAAALLMRGVRPWRTVAESLDQSRLRHLIKGLVLYSQASGWSGGSVSPIIQLYKAFVERFPEAEPDLNRWILDNRRNPYEPFGSMMFDDAPTLREHDALWAAYRKDREAAVAQREATRVQRIASDATSKLPNAVRRGDLVAVQALIAKGGDPHARDESGVSLEEVADAAGRDDVAAFLRGLKSA